MSLFSFSDIEMHIFKRNVQILHVSSRKMCDLSSPVLIITVIYVIPEI